MIIGPSTLMKKLLSKRKKRLYRIKSPHCEMIFSSIPGDTEKKNIQERIDALNAEKRSLGLFKGKRKKQYRKKLMLPISNENSC